MHPTHPVTILVADGHPIFRRRLCDIIARDSSLGLLAEATDGEQAWALIQELCPTIAVLDIHIPKRNGIELSQLVAQQRLDVALIILMDSEEALLNEALHLGIKGYLLKETAVADLLQAIHRVATGSAYVSPAFSGALMGYQAEPADLRSQKPGLGRLSPTERQVLRLIAQDRTSKEIAELLHSSVRTVETHRQNISYKLDLSGAHSLLRFAFDHRAQL